MMNKNNDKQKYTTLPDKFHLQNCHFVSQMSLIRFNFQNNYENANSRESYCNSQSGQPNSNDTHCVKSVLIQNYSGPYFPVFRLKMERYAVSLRIQSKCGKTRTRLTPNMDPVNAVTIFRGSNQSCCIKKVFLKILQNSQESPFAGVSFLIRL